MQDEVPLLNCYKNELEPSPCCETDGVDVAEKEDLQKELVQWSTSDGKKFIPSRRTVDRITPGVYEIRESNAVGLYFSKIPIRTEGLVRFPDSNSDKVIDELRKFWEREDTFKEYGIIYKRGIMLYGPPGSGKSCTIQHVMDDVVNIRKGIVLKFQEPILFLEGMRALREIHPDIPVVALMEDIESIIRHYDESSVLNVLDGVNEVNKVVFLATTNYPKELGSRIINRPSRFDKRFRIGHPSPEARRIYFEHLISKEKIEELRIDLDAWVNDTEEMSIAHLKELFVAVVVLGDDYNEAVETLRDMKENVDDSEGGADMGFRSNAQKGRAIEDNS